MGVLTPVRPVIPHEDDDEYDDEEDEDEAA